MNKTILQYALLFVIICFFVFFPVTQAVIADTDATLLGAWHKAGSAARGAGYDVDSNTNNVNSLIAIIIRTALSLLGVIFLALLVYGGYLWMTDKGNEDQVKRARNLISAAVIGLIIVLSAYAISIFVLDQLASQTLEAPEVE
ncbi:hypothetical protein KAR28_00165 [Candidatus Parcubacteria bacterium]|nr:hypothetical protein [Candidatus Parcubacteria bacterium]